MKSDDFSVTCGECGEDFEGYLEEEDLVEMLKDKYDRTFLLRCDNCDSVTCWKLLGYSVRINPS